MASKSSTNPSIWNHSHKRENTLGKSIKCFKDLDKVCETLSLKHVYDKGQAARFLISWSITWILIDLWLYGEEIIPNVTSNQHSYVA